MELSMRHLMTVMALALCTSVSAQSIKLDTDSPVTTTTTIESNTSSSVTSSTGAVTHSIVGTTGSMCSAVGEGRRCEIACQAPQMAQCEKGVEGGGPTCVCR